jgi:predicted transcriptional regulator
MTREVEIHVVGGFDALSARVSDAVKRHTEGQDVREDHLTFSDWDAMSKTMTAKRLELLRHLHRNPQDSVAALARSLGRDYRRVHEDVDILVAAGLIDRHGLALRTGYDEIRAVIAL